MIPVVGTRAFGDVYVSTSPATVSSLYPEGWKMRLSREQLRQVLLTEEMIEATTMAPLVLAAASAQT